MTLRNENSALFSLSHLRDLALRDKPKGHPQETIIPPVTLPITGPITISAFPYPISPKPKMPSWALPAIVGISTLTLVVVILGFIVGFQIKNRHAQQDPSSMVGVTVPPKQRPISPQSEPLGSSQGHKATVKKPSTTDQVLEAIQPQNESKRKLTENQSAKISKSKGRKKHRSRRIKRHRRRKMRLYSKRRRRRIKARRKRARARYSKRLRKKKKRRILPIKNSEIDDILANAR